MSLITSISSPLLDDDDPLLPWEQVRPLVGGISRQTWRRRIEEGKAPKPFKVSTQHNAWLKSEIMEYRATLQRCN